MNTQQFARFVNERHNIYLRRGAGKPKPWTTDPILQQYRFCNVYRENDRVTKWIAKNWRCWEDPDVWFAMVVARVFNSPDTLEQLGFPVPFTPKNMLEVIAQRQRKGLKVFNAAYIVSTNGVAMAKGPYLIQRVFTPMWKARKALRPTRTDTLETFGIKLQAFQGMGTFMTAQVIADLKYVAPLDGAEDWWTFARSGPGSKRGMNRLLGNAARDAIGEAKWYAALMALQHATKGKIPQMHAQDLQNCLCEFDKYERVRLGEGVPKQLYNGGK